MAYEVDRSSFYLATGIVLLALGPVLTMDGGIKAGIGVALASGILMVLGGIAAMVMSVLAKRRDDASKADPSEQEKAPTAQTD